MGGDRGPALVVDPAVAEHLEVLRGVPLRGPRLVEGVGERDAVERRLLDPVDRLGEGDACHVEERRQDVVDVMPLVSHLAARPDARGPVHDQPVARAAVVGGHLLGPLVRRVHRDRPARGVVRVGVRPAELARPLREEPRDPLRVLLDAVEVQALVERAGVAALGRCPVVAEDVENDRVVELAALAQRRDHPAHLGVGVLGEGGVQLHQVLTGLALEVGDLVPVRDAGGPRRQLRVLRYDAQPLLPLEGDLALAVPAVRELPAVPVPPRLRNLEGRMGRAERQVAEPRLVRRVAAHVAGPGDRAVGQVLGEVVALGGGARRVDEGGAVDEGRLELAGLTAEEAVEAVEALAGRPAVERPGGGLLHGGVWCHFPKAPVL